MTVRNFLSETGLTFSDRDVSAVAGLCKTTAFKNGNLPPKTLIKEGDREIMIYDYPESFIETMADICINYFTAKVNG